MTPNQRNRVLAGLLALAGLMGSSALHAAASVSWDNLQSNTAPVGTHITPTGQATATGFVGDQSDIMFVLDASGSMASNATVGGITQSLAEWQKDIFGDITDSLAASAAGVAGKIRLGVAAFTSFGSLRVGLTDISTAAGVTAVKNAINGVNPGGGTNIPAGQTVAFNELSANSALLDPAVLSGYIVSSDGFSSGDPDATSDVHNLAGVDLIASVGFPGADDATMQGIVNGLDDIFGNADDTGPYVDGTDDVQDILDAIAGGGALVGIDQVDLTLPDGTVFADVALDAFGNFVTPVPYNIGLGPNTWTAFATATDGTTATATITVIGTQVPAPGVVALLGIGVFGMGLVRRLRQQG